jgi:hypothetical protein
MPLLHGKNKNPSMAANRITSGNGGADYARMQDGTCE